MEVGEGEGVKDDGDAVTPKEWAHVQAARFNFVRKAMPCEKRADWLAMLLTVPRADAKSLGGENPHDDDLEPNNGEPYSESEDPTTTRAAKNVDKEKARKRIPAKRPSNTAKDFLKVCFELVNMQIPVTSLPSVERLA